jgi:hypothetical protein
MESLVEFGVATIAILPVTWFGLSREEDALIRREHRRSQNNFHPPHDPSHHPVLV